MMKRVGVDGGSGSLLPWGLLRRAGKDGDCFELVEAAPDGGRIVLPSHAGVVVDEGALSEGIRASGGLRREGWGSLGSWLRGWVLVSSERVCSGRSGL